MFHKPPFSLNQTPDHDPKLGGNHPQVMANLAGEQIEVDIKLRDLLERINQTELVSTMSCQYNRFGWTVVSVMAQPFMRLLDRLRRQHIKVFGPGVCDKSLWSSMAHIDDDLFYYGGKICFVLSSVDQFDGHEFSDDPADEDSALHLTLYMLPSNVDLFIEQWDRLFSPVETFEETSN